MKIGLTMINSGSFSSPDLFGFCARTAEQLGFESLWSVEHVVIPKNFSSPYPYSRDGKLPGANNQIPISDPLLPLAYAAALTSKVRLGTGVIILPQRHPLYLAKEIASLDVLSKGRMLLGIGGGWLREEFEALGIPFASRGARTNEAIEAIRAVWRDDEASYRGKYYSFDSAYSYPKPAQKNGVPILVGGNAPAAIARAARLGDGYFPVANNLDKTKEQFAMLKRECEKLGRNYDDIELSVMGRASADFVKQCEDMGVVRVVATPPAFDRENLQRGLEKLATELRI